MVKKRVVKSTKRQPLNIFISHSHKDQMEVDRIAKRLRIAGHAVWIDRLHLRPGDNFQQKIHQALEEADILIVVMSENSFRSEWVQHEFATIFFQEGVSKRHRRIIPIKLDQVSVPSYIANLHWLDFSTDFDAGLDRLVADLRLDGASQVTVPISVDETDTHIRKLRDALRRGRLTLICGAGVSIAAGIPSWNHLLFRLLDRLMNRLSKDYSLDLEESTTVEFQKSYGTSSSLILGKYLKNNLGDDFPSETRDALYVQASESSELIKVIAELSRPQRDAKPLDSIITFNFDCLIEEQLQLSSIWNKSIFSESIRHDGNELPIYHVHGYLPRHGDIPKTELVFSEDAYHSQFIDAFSWSNLIQLAKLTQNVCLFIGISLTDPNMRRLLDVAWRKNSEKTISHFIVKKRADHKKDSALNQVAHILEEQDANTLGLNVIWIDNFDELPKVLTNIIDPS